MRHQAAQPDVPVQPEAAIHCIDHSLSALREFLPFGHQRCRILRRRERRHERPTRARQWQLTTPSGSPGYGGELTTPEYTAHVSGNDCGCVALADQPPFVAATMVRTTPLDIV